MHVQNYSTEKMSVYSAPVPSKADRNQFWPRSHTALSTLLCLTEHALQLESTLVVSRMGNLASDPSCTGHDWFGRGLKYYGEETDFQKSITGKTSNRPVKA